ncbi:MAG: T9SS type A sorting domain-containing protein [Flavobacteriales bacterium]|nr:T9SS type A sorting domain-containing protein [Flavobacteriales bacterium]
MKRIVLALWAVVLVMAAHAQQLQAVTYIQHATCGNTTGSIVLSAWGGLAPYTFLWSPTPPTGQGTTSITDAPPGLYTVTITDSNADQLVVDAEIILTPDLFLSFVPGGPAWSCDGGCDGAFYYWFPINGVNPYVTTFDPPGPVGNATPNGMYISQLCAGETYTVTVTDDAGCAGTFGPLDVVGPMAPALISSSVTGSCPGGSTGSLTIEFSQVDSIIVTGPSGSYYVESTNPYTITNIPAGTYQVFANIGGQPTPPGTTGYCSATFEVIVPVSTDPCGSVSGVAYADLDANCVQDATDPGLPYRVLEIGPGGNYALTAIDGTYATELFYGSYDLDATFANYDILCPALPAPFTLDAVTPSATIDLAAEPTFGPDVRATLYSGVHRPGFAVSYWVTVQNDGPYAFSDLVVDLNYDPILTFTSAQGGGAWVAAGHVQWTALALAPFESVTYEVHLAVPNIPALIGTTMTGTATVTPTPVDSDPSNDTYSITRTVVNSYDPNDKLARTSSQASDAYYFLDIDTYIDYTVRFQNTGTAEAINVTVNDTISDLLDMVSLEILGASHPFTAQILTGRVLSFTFANIMLPDSTSDLLGSQGFVSFRLKPISGLPVLTGIPNTADIYFDFNDPIRTNTAVLVTEMSVGIGEQFSIMGLRPNPVRDQLAAELPQNSALVEVLSMDGRVLLRTSARTSTVRMDVSALPTGAYLLRAIATDGSVANARFVKD